MSAPDRRTYFEFLLPPELEAGAYANVFEAWHTVHEFTLDFAVTRESYLEESGDPEAPVTVACRVVSRVRIPATIAFEVIRTLNEELTRYESRFGEIRRPDEGTP